MCVQSCKPLLNNQPWLASARGMCPKMVSFPEQSITAKCARRLPTKYSRGFCVCSKEVQRPIVQETWAKLFSREPFRIWYYETVYFHSGDPH